MNRPVSPRIAANLRAPVASRSLEAPEAQAPDLAQPERPDANTRAHDGVDAAADLLARIERARSLLDAARAELDGDGGLAVCAESSVHAAMPDTIEEERLALRPEEAAKALGVSLRTLWTIKTDRSTGIPFVQFGRTVLYPVRELREWLTQRAGGRRS